MDVLLSEAGDAEGLVFQRVVLTPHPEISDVEQAHDRREHPLPAEVVFGQVTPHPRPKFRQGRPEILNSDELLAVPVLPPLVVVAVLAAAGRVGADRLNMAVRPRADPDVRPGRWYNQTSNALESVLIGDPNPVGIGIAEAAAAAPPRNAGS